jgi:hypothetical protein
MTKTTKLAYDHLRALADSAKTAELHYDDPRVIQMEIDAFKRALELTDPIYLLREAYADSFKLEDKNRHKAALLLRSSVFALYKSIVKYSGAALPAIDLRPFDLETVKFNEELLFAASQSRFKTPEACLDYAAKSVKTHSGHLSGFFTLEPSPEEKARARALEAEARRQAEAEEAAYTESAALRERLSDLQETLDLGLEIPAIAAAGAPEYPSSKAVIKEAYFIEAANLVKGLPAEFWPAYGKVSPKPAITKRRLESIKNLTGEGRLKAVCADLYKAWDASGSSRAPFKAALRSMKGPSYLDRELAYQESLRGSIEALEAQITPAHKSREADFAETLESLESEAEGVIMESGLYGSSAEPDHRLVFDKSEAKFQTALAHGSYPEAALDRGWILAWLTRPYYANDYPTKYAKEILLRLGKEASDGLCEKLPGGLSWELEAGYKKSGYNSFPTWYEETFGACKTAGDYYAAFYPSPSHSEPAGASGAGEKAIQESRRAESPDSPPGSDLPEDDGTPEYAAQEALEALAEVCPDYPALLEKPWKSPCGTGLLNYLKSIIEMTVLVEAPVDLPETFRLVKKPTSERLEVRIKNIFHDLEDLMGDLTNTQQDMTPPPIQVFFDRFAYGEAPADFFGTSPIGRGAPSDPDEEAEIAEELIDLTWDTLAKIPPRKAVIHSLAKEKLADAARWNWSHYIHTCKQIQADVEELEA